MTSTVLTAVLGVVVTLNVDRVRGWLSDRTPLEAHVTVSTEPPPWYSMVVPDPGRLPSGVGTVKDCDRLWRTGLAAGGVVAGASAHRILLRGLAKSGVTIIDMRAKVTRHAPAIDGALLECPSAGSLDPIGLSFNLAEADSAPAQRVDKTTEDSHPMVNQFANGYAIAVAEGESVPLMVETDLPADAVDWRIEADVLVGGERRTIVIDNEGKDFYSPGSRAYNQYRAGHGAGVLLSNWGLDDRAQRAGGRLTLGTVSVPDLSGLDIYQPQEDGDGDSPYRWIRHNGHKILNFNPPGAVPRGFLADGDFCGDVDAHYGFVRTSKVISTETREHGDQRFTHWTIDYQCSLSEGGSRGDVGTAAFWTCGSKPCPEETHRLWAARRVGSDVLFGVFSYEIAADQDRALVERLLGEVRVG